MYECLCMCYLFVYICMYICMHLYYKYDIFSNMFRDTLATSLAKERYFNTSQSDHNINESLPYYFAVSFSTTEH